MCFKILAMLPSTGVTSSTRNVWCYCKKEKKKKEKKKYLSSDPSCSMNKRLVPNLHEQKSQNLPFAILFAY